MHEGSTPGFWVALGWLVGLASLAGFAFALRRRRRFFGEEPELAWENARKLLQAGNPLRLVALFGAKSPQGPVEKLVLVALAHEDSEPGPEPEGAYRSRPPRVPHYELQVARALRSAALAELLRVEQLCAMVLALGALPLMVFGLGLLAGVGTSLWLGGVGATAALGLAAVLWFWSWRARVVAVLEQALAELPAMLTRAMLGRDDFAAWTEASQKAREALASPKA